MPSFPQSVSGGSGSLCIWCRRRRICMCLKEARRDKKKEISSNWYEIMSCSAGYGSEYVWLHTWAVIAKEGWGMSCMNRITQDSREGTHSMLVSLCLAENPRAGENPKGMQGMRAIRCRNPRVLQPFPVYLGSSQSCFHTWSLPTNLEGQGEDPEVPQ